MDLGLVNNILNELKGDSSNPLHQLYLYGSQLKGSDIDLFAITKKKPLQQYIIIGKVDIYFQSMDDFYDKINKLDTLVTEPLLTGKLLFGDENEHSYLIKKLINTKICSEHLTYLMSCSFNEYLNSLSFRKQFEFDNSTNSLLWGLVNLSYAYSYFHFAKYYSSVSTQSAVTLSKIINDSFSKEIDSLIKALKEFKHKNDSISAETFDKYSAQFIQKFLKNNKG